MPEQQPDCRQEIISINPANETELGRVEAVGRQGVDRAMENARQAAGGWSSCSMTERKKLLSRLQQLILQEKNTIAELIVQEQGKPFAEAFTAEVLPVLALLKELIRQAPRLLADEPAPIQTVLFAHKKSRYRYVPYGVIGVISPWNFPFSIPVPEIAAALIAGNTVVFKPAPQSVLIGKKIAELFKRAGFPDGVMNTVYLHDIDAAYMSGHAGLDKIIFTGSTVVGAQVMAAASRNITPVVLELGGKDAAIVAADADVERAAKGIVWGSMVNAGQVCAAVERVYVEKPVAERFIQACLAEMHKLRIGDPLQEGTDIGPLAVKKQLDKVEEQIADARAKGATALCGGNRLGQRGYFFSPTLLTNVHHGMKVMTEETFGPVLPIMVVDSLDEAIRLANDSPYGLSAYGWTNSKLTADRLMKELLAGTVLINDSTMSWGEPSAPWVGFKQSGIGLTHGRFGLQEMVHIQYVSYDRGGNEGNLWWFPYQGGKQIFSAACDLLFRPIGAAKFKGLLAMLHSKRFIKTTHWSAVLRNWRKMF
jgi:acyl-CoA reductase-like NAD-dependent aldehyde dehydrogenase